MKIFALNLCIHLEIPEPYQPYQFTFSSIEKVQEILATDKSAANRQFYIQADNTDDLTQQVFEIQADEASREIPATISIQFPDAHRRLKFLRSFQSLFQVKEAAGGLVVNELGAYLCILHRSVWTLPKGMIEPNESNRLAAIREVREETGLQQVEITSSLPYTVHTFARKQTWIWKITHWFNMFAPSNQVLSPQLEEQIEAVRWFHKSEWLEVAATSYPLTRAIFEHEFAQSMR